MRRGHADLVTSAVGGPARLRVVTLLASVLALSSADTATVGATAVDLEPALHIGNTEIGLLVTVSTAVGAVATLPAGVLTDRINRTNLLAGAILVWSIAMVASGAAQSFIMLLAARLGLGAVVAVAGPTVASLTGDLFPAADRGRIYGFILSGELIGGGLGFVASGDIAAALSWRYSFWVLAGPAVVLAASIWRLLPEPARGGQSRLAAGAETIPSVDEVEAGREPAQHPGQDPDAGGRRAEGTEIEQEARREHVEPHERLVLHHDPRGRSLWWTVRYVLSIRTNVVIIVASGLGYFFFSGLRTFAVLFMHNRFGVGQGVAGSLLFLMGTGSVVGALSTGRLADRLLRRHVLTARPLIAGLSFLASVALFVPGLLIPGLIGAAPVFFLAAAALGGANPPLDAARLDLIHSSLWGRAESVRTVLRTSFEAAAPLLFGFVSARFGAQITGLGHPVGAAAHSGSALDETFILMLAPVLVAALLLLLLARRTYPRDVVTAAASEHRFAP